MVAVHHAIVFEGDRAASLVAARAYVADTLGCVVEGNPDVDIATCERFVLRDAHDLRERACRMPFGTRHVFVRAFAEITLEAQNALLKLFEEPTAYTSFVLVVPTVSRLLPTVRSRLFYGGRYTGVLAEQEHARAFVRAPVGKRLALVASLTDGAEPDRAGARAFIDALESVLHDEGVYQNARALREVAFVRAYLTDTASSLKMLLEHLAVAV